MLDGKTRVQGEGVPGPVGLVFFVSGIEVKRIFYL